MPDLEAPVESSHAANALSARIPLADLNELFRKTLQLSKLALIPGLPRRISPESATRWFSGPHVLVALTRTTSFDALTGFVAVPVEQALAVVDRALGGPGQGYQAGPSGAPNEAECGVLAYLAARCVQLCAPDLRVSDVGVRPAGALLQALEEALLWPLQVTLADALRIDLKVVFATGAQATKETHLVRLGLRESSSELALRDVRPGDLLVFDGVPFTLTARGPCAMLELEAEGFEERIAIAVTGTALSARLGSGMRQRPEENSVTVVIHECRLALDQLAQLCAGMPFSFSDLWNGSAQLVTRGRCVADGTLVRYAGSLALLVRETYSIR